MAKAKFRYKIKDSHGQIKYGRAMAADAASVRRMLSGKGYAIESIVEEKKAFSQLFSHVSAKDRSLIYRELATMLKAGVSITQAINITAETPNKHLRRVLLEMAVSLENGFPFSMTMSSHPQIFPSVEVGVVKAGEATGNLSKVLDDLATSSSRTADFNAKVKGALVYPIFVVITMVVIGVIIMVKVIPPIRAIFDESGVPLPWTTRFLIGFTDVITNYWYFVVGGIIIIGLGIKAFFSTKKGHKVGSQIALNVPLFGMLNQQVYLARFNRTLSLLVGAGVPIIESVEIITDSTTNVIYRNALFGLAKSLEQGSAISTSLQSNKYFPKLMTQLLLVGQQSGDLGGTATTLANYYENEVDNKLKAMSSLLEPMIIVLLGLAVGFVIVSVLQPIYNLTQAIG